MHCDMVCASNVADSAIPTNTTGHNTADTKAPSKLTFYLDYSEGPVGANFPNS